MDGSPVIGVTAHRERVQWAIWDREAEIIGSEYVDAVADAGGAAVLIPARMPVLPGMIGRLDGLILSGGPDVDPAGYGARAHPRTDPPSPERDAVELQALDIAVDLGVPVLAVCRGAQLLNVWAGGDLVQHLADHPGNLRHGGHGSFDLRTVTVGADSRLHDMAGSTVLARCHHHQAIGVLGTGLSVVARAEDGVVEGVELEGPVPVLGVQWHPEEARGDGLIGSFVRLAEARATARR